MPDPDAAPEQRRYLLDVPGLRLDDNSPDYLRRIRESLRIADAGRKEAGNHGLRG